MVWADLHGRALQVSRQGRQDRDLGEIVNPSVFSIIPLFESRTHEYRETVSTRSAHSSILTRQSMRQSLPIWSARGSEWHRWDPHIHAPGTVLEDGFAGDWEGYLTRIESAIPTIRALGVTDYCSIEAYRQVRQRKAGGRLP